MKKGLTEIIYILDRSGSMGGLEADTIGGYNSMLAKQKKEERLLFSDVWLWKLRDAPDGAKELLQKPKTRK